MSKILEDRIREIMKGVVLSEDKKMEKDAASKKAASQEETDDEGQGSHADKVAKGNTGKLKTSDGDFESDLPRAGKGGSTFKSGSDKFEVKETVDTDPEIGRSLTGDTTSGQSGDSKTAKIKSKQSGSQEKQAKLGKTEPGSSADEQDPAAKQDTDKIKKGLSNQEKGGRLHAEHMEALFDGEQLSEEFMFKAETIFEAAVAHAAEARLAELQEEQLQEMNEAVEVVKGELVEQIDGYLDEIVEQWMDDNAVALESGMKVELVNSFIDGIKNVFTEHYVEVPEDKVDVVEEQAIQIEELQDALASLQEEKESALAESAILRCEEIISEQAKGLTAIETEKFKSLVENIEFETEEEFATKAKIIRESHFKGMVVKNNSQEVTKQITEDRTPSSTVNAVVAALQSGAKFVR